MSTRGVRECLAVICGAVVLTAALLYDDYFVAVRSIEINAC